MRQWQKRVIAQVCFIFFFFFFLFQLVVVVVVGFMLLLSFKSVLVYLLLQIRSASRSYIILFTSLKVRRSTLLLSWRLLMLNPKNKKGILFVSFNETKWFCRLRTV